jgi:hypothetical protein
MIKHEVDKNQRPESVDDAEVQASILDKISEVSSKINSMEAQLASVEDLGQRTLHTYDKEIEMIKYDQNHLLHQIRCQSELAERESRRVYARFDAMEANLPKMVAEVLAARPEEAPDEAVLEQHQVAVNQTLRAMQGELQRQGQALHLVEESVMRTDQNITRRKGQQKPFPNDISGIERSSPDVSPVGSDGILDEAEHPVARSALGAQDMSQAEVLGSMFVEYTEVLNKTFGKAISRLETLAAVGVGGGGDDGDDGDDDEPSGPPGRPWRGKSKRDKDDDECTKFRVFKVEYK